MLNIPVGLRFQVSYGEICNSTNSRNANFCLINDRSRWCSRKIPSTMEITERSSKDHDIARIFMKLNHLEWTIRPAKNFGDLKNLKMLIIRSLWRNYALPTTGNIIEVHLNISVVSQKFWRFCLQLETTQWREYADLENARMPHTDFTTSTYSTHASNGVLWPLFSSLLRVFGPITRHEGEERGHEKRGETHLLNRLL